MDAPTQPKPYSCGAAVVAALPIPAAVVGSGLAVLAASPAWCARYPNFPWGAESRFGRRLIEVLDGASAEAGWSFHRGTVRWLIRATALVVGDLRLVLLTETAAETEPAGADRFDMAMAASGDGVWDVDLVRGRTWFSARWKAIVGYEDHEVSDDIEESLARLHPDDAPRIQALMQRVLTDPDYVPGEFELRSRHKDGSYRWLVNRGRVVERGPDGRPLRLMGFVTDVSERVALVERLREVTESLRLVTDTVNAAFWVIGAADLQLQYASSSFERVHGFSAEVARHQRGVVRQRLHPDDLPAFKQIFNATPDAPVSCEVRVIDAPGLEPRWLRVRSHQVGGLNGQARRLVGFSEDITAVRAAADALRESEARYRALVEHAPDGIFVSVKDQVTYCNPAFVRLMRAPSAEALLGRSPLTFIHPRTHEAIRQRLARLRAGEPDAPKQRETYLRCDGSEVEVEVVAVRLELGGQLGIQLLVHDITDRLQQEMEILRLNAELEHRVVARTAELEESRELFAAFMRHTPTIAYMKDAKGRLQYVNDAYIEQIWGGEARFSYLNRTDFDLWPAELAAAYRANDLTVLQRGAVVTVEEPMMVEGELQTWLCFKFPILRAGGRAWLGCVALNITDRKRHEADMVRLNEELEARVRARTRQLEVSASELESFSYSVSHDLRAPLRSIIGFSRALEEDCGPNLGEEGVGHLRRIQNAAARMGQLIEDLLELSRVTRTELRRAPVDLTALAETAVEELRRSAPNTAQVCWEIAPLLRCEGDARLLLIVLTNLFANAAKFSARSDPPTVRFFAEVAGDRTWFVVADNGVGFDPRYAHRLFTPFYRLHDAREFPGTGIGLATVQRVIHRHDGAVRAEGSVGQGARISFTLWSTF